MAELPRSASHEAAIQSLIARLTGQSAIWNPRRLLGATETAASLNREGFTDNTTFQEGARDQAGNVTYRLVRGLDGRLYRQRFRQTNAAFNAQGTAESSFADRAQREGKRELDTARESTIRGFEAGQASTFGQQAEEYRGYADQLGGANAQYADWRAQQPVAYEAPIGFEPSVTPEPSIGAPHPGSGTPSQPRIIKVGQIESPHQASMLALNNPGYKLKKRGGKLGYVLHRQS
jgi:hypothetical protein